MNNISTRMLNKNIKPNEEDMLKYCGKSKDLLQKLDLFICELFNINKEIKFPYGNNYGWCFSYHNKKKLICNIFVEKDCFNVMVRISSKEIESVYSLVSSYTKNVIDHKYPCSDGGWIHYEVLSKENLEDIMIIIRSKY